MSMKDRPKLGRGLSDVSPFFLSRATVSEPQQRGIVSPVPRPKTVTVCHPSSPLVQSFLSANLALEMARNRHGVSVWDCSANDEARLTVLMRALMNGQEAGPDGGVLIRLYGLPSIVIMDGRPDGPPGQDGFSGEPPDLQDGEGGPRTLINARADMDFIIRSAPSEDAVILTRTDDLSLLQCYAYIKTIHRGSEGCRIWIVFDGEGRDPGPVFDRLSGFVGQRLGCSLSFLGTLVHDEAMERSIREERPLVLFSGDSAARDSLAGICARFMAGSGPAGEEAGS